MEELQQQNLHLQGQLGQLQHQIQELQARTRTSVDPGEAFQAHLQADRADRQVAREAKRLDICDGEEPAQVKRYLKELDLVDTGRRLAVVRQTARGALRREFERFISAHHDASWLEVKTHLLASFVSVDNVEALKQELSKIRQEPFESILSYNRRFRELAEEAYPTPSQGQRTQDQERAIIKAYGKGLALDSTARKLTSQGWPRNLEAAMDRTSQLETAQTVYDHLGRLTEPMEVGAAPASRPQPYHAQPLKPPQPQPSRELQQLRTHIAKLEAQIQRLHDSRVPPRAPSQSACYICKREGHFARDCRVKPRSMPHKQPSQTKN